jgi:hypothetical protein
VTVCANNVALLHLSFNNRPRRTVRYELADIRHLFPANMVEFKDHDVCLRAIRALQRTQNDPESLLNLSTQALTTFLHQRLVLLSILSVVRLGGRFAAITTHRLKTVALRRIRIES